MTTQATAATSAWWILQNVSLARMLLKSFIQIPRTALFRAPCSRSPKEGSGISGDSSKSESEEDVGDSDYSFTDGVKERRHLGSSGGTC